MATLNPMSRTVTSGNPDASPLLRARNIAGIIGIIGIIAAAIIGIGGDTNFMQSYLLAFIFWTGMSLGCFVLLTVVHLAGGSWGALIRKPLEAGLAVLPLMAILVIPVFFGIGSLYPWADQAYVDSHPLVGAKSIMLNTPGFIIRNIIYFGIWIAGAVVALRGSARQDEEETGAVAYKLKGLGPVWLMVYVMTMTFAAIDWGMSLTPEWFSGIYAAIMMGGQAVAAMSLMVLVASGLARFNPLVDRLLTEKRLQDLGNFMMAFTMFWAYLSISQLIIIWSNNTVETSGYYVARITGPWEPVAIALTIIGFFAPFVILFSRWVKRKRLALGLVAIWLILTRMLDLYWIIVPSFGRVAPEFRWLDVVVLLTMGAIWLAVYLHSLASRPLVPLRDPRLQEALHHEH